MTEERPTKPSSGAVARDLLVVAWNAVPEGQDGEGDAELAAIAEEN